MRLLSYILSKHDARKEPSSMLMTRVQTTHYYTLRYYYYYQPLQLHYDYSYYPFIIIIPQSLIA
jgi:hypothetical protein